MTPLALAYSASVAREQRNDHGRSMKTLSLFMKVLVVL